MYFKDWLFSEEIYPNKTATVYHRTKSLDDISSILSKGFRSGEGDGCLYGCGLYTTFDLRSQFDSYMERYGKYILKFKVTNLENYLIIPINVAKYILGKEYRISDQFYKRAKDKIVNDNKSKYGDSYDHEHIAKQSLDTAQVWQKMKQDLMMYDKKQETDLYSGELTKQLHTWYQNDDIFKEFSGVIYRGQNDGYCLLKYEPVGDSTITMLGYAEAPIERLDYQDRLKDEKINQLLNNQGWETSTSNEKIKYVWSKPLDKRPEVSLKDDFALLKDAVSNNSLFRFKKLLEKRGRISTSEFYQIIHASKERVKALKILMKFLEETGRSIDPLNVYHILGSDFKEKEEMAEVLGSKSIRSLTEENIKYLLEGSSDLDKAQEVIDILIKYKKSFSSKEVWLFLIYSKDKKKTAESLGANNIRKLGENSFFVYDLVNSAIDTKEIAEIIGKENISLAYDNDHERGAYIVNKLLTGLRNSGLSKEEIIDLIGQENVNRLSMASQEEPQLSAV